VTADDTGWQRIGEIAKEISEIEKMFADKPITEEWAQALHMLRDELNDLTESQSQPRIHHE
jgi:hypothetical protein